MKRICKFCGNEFTVKCGRQKCCSRACHVMLKKTEKFKTQKLLNEKASSDGRNWDVVATSENALEYVTTEHECPVCGKMFYPKSVIQRTCGTACSIKYYAIRKRAEKRPHLLELRKCAHCGKEYMPVRSDSKFCSKECRKKAHIEGLNQWNKENKGKETQTLKTTTYQCKICGKMFTPKKCMNEKCCSPECSAENYRRLKQESRKNSDRRKGIEHKRCEWCGKEFPALYSRQRFCSPNCAYLFRQHKRAVRFRDLYPIRICVECGKEFQPWRRDQVRCSKECIEAAKAKFRARIHKENVNVNAGAQRERDQLMETAAVKNQQDSTDKYKKMLELSGEQLKAAYDALSATEKREYLSFYRRTYSIAAGNKIVRSFRKHRNKPSEFANMVNSMLQGKGYSPKWGKLDNTEQIDESQGKGTVACIET